MKDLHHFTIQYELHLTLTNVFSIKNTNTYYIYSAFLCQIHWYFVLLLVISWLVIEWIKVHSKEQVKEKRKIINASK